MSLLFTGSIPWYWLLILFVGLCVYTHYMYRRMALTGPWRWRLPVLRIAVFALLILALFQPVLSRIATQVIRGSIAIVLDDSGSMSLRDRYQGADWVPMANQLGLLPDGFRATVVGQDDRRYFSPDALDQMGRQIHRLHDQLDNHRPWEEVAADARMLRRQVRAQAQRLSRVPAVMSSAASDHAYLKHGSADGNVQQVEVLLYQGIGGNFVKDVTKHANYPDTPSQRLWVNTPMIENKGDNYGTVIRGYLVPPQTGNYKFRLRSDDEGQLWLSTDHTPADIRLIGSVNVRESDIGKPVALEANRWYYFEMRHKEGHGGDYVSLGWTLPDGKRHMPVKTDHIRSPHAKPGAGSYAHVAKRLLKHIKVVQGELEKWQGLLDAIDEKQAAAGPEAKRLRDAWRTHGKTLLQYWHQLNGLQFAADEALASAKDDVVIKAREQLTQQSRFSLVRWLWQRESSALRNALAEKGDLEFFLLSEVGVGAGAQSVNLESLETMDSPRVAKAQTPLGSTIQDVLKSYGDNPVSAVMVFSDGNQNAGMALPDAKAITNDRGIPILTVGVGSPSAPPDVVLEQVNAPPATFVGDKVHMQVAIRRGGFETRNLKLGVFKGDQLVHEQTITGHSSTQQQVDVSFTEDAPGQHQYRVRLEPLGDEILHDNNEKLVDVMVLKDKIQALFIDEFPRWESRYINMMLKRDRRIQLRTIFIGSQPRGVLPMGEGGFPQDHTELLKYGMIILGDINPRHFTPEQMENLRDVVIKGGATLILLAGQNYMPTAFSNTALGSLVPVHLGGSDGMFDRADMPDAKKGKVARRELTTVGQADALTRLGVSAEGSATLWGELPEFTWAHRDVEGKLSADVLVRDGQNTPLLVKSNVGLGKVLYIGTDEIWRWRYRARWRYHHRFWGQVMLWATQGRTQGTDKHVKLMTERTSYAPDEVVTVRLRLVDEQGFPINGASPSAVIVNEAGENQRIIPLQFLSGSSGEYRGQVRALPKGKYLIKPTIPDGPQPEATTVLPLDIRDLPTAEFVELSLNERNLKQLGDYYATLPNVTSLIDHIKPKEITREQPDNTPLWDTWWMLLVVTILLGVEWQVRKQLHMV